MNVRHLSLKLWPIGLLAAAACTPMHLQIDTDLQTNGQQHQLSEKPGLFDHKPYVIGDFRTEKVDVSWAKGTGSNITIAGMGKLDSTKTQTFVFTLVDNKLKKTIAADCGLTRHREAVKLSKLTNSSETEDFTCTLKPQGSGEPWSLAMNAVDGSLKRGTDQYSVAAEHNTDSGHTYSDALGYSFRHNDRAAAEVVTATDPGFWLQNALLPEQRLVLAAASTAILIKNQRDSTKETPGS